MPPKTRLIEANITSCSWHLNGTKASSKKNFLNWEEQGSGFLFPSLQELDVSYLLLATINQM